MSRKSKHGLRMRCVSAVFTGLVFFAAGTTSAQVTSQLWGVSGEAWDPTNSVLRDFTDVGYMSGDVAIPDWPVGVIVTNFGAIPDDCSDDSQAFIDAIAACPSNHAVFVPNGRYLITDQIVVDRDYVVVRGEDMYRTVLFFPKNMGERYPQADYGAGLAKGAFFHVDDGTHRSIENLTFEFREQTKMGHWEWRGAYAMRYGGDVVDSWIRNIYFKNVDEGIQFGGAERISVLNIIFDQYIGRYDFIGSSGITRWVGHAAIRMTANRCLMHNIEIKGKYFHDFDIINVPSYCVVSGVKGTDMSLNNHGQGANHNLYTEIYAGTGTRIIGLTQYQNFETFWNIDGYIPIDPAMFTNSLENGHVMVGIGADYPTTVTPGFYYESIDPSSLTPSNLYLAQMAYRGKPLPEGPPPQPPLPPELTGDVRILNPTDDISGAGGDPDSGTLGFSGYMKFDLNDLEDLGTIAKARVRICTASRKAGSGSFTLSVASVADDSWTQDTITTNPAAGAVLDSVVIDDELIHKWWELDITPFVQAEWSGDKTVSLHFSNNRPGSFIGSMTSRERGNAPQLIIERVADPVPGPPAAPTGVETVSSNGYIVLNWDDAPEADFATYNVYRLPDSNASHPIAQGLVISDFADISDKENRAICEMSSNTVFRYRVTAVDEHGYESLPAEFFGTTLHPSNDPPVFASETNLLSSAGEDGAYSGSLLPLASDPESDPLYFFKVSGPEWLIIAEDGILSGIPDASDSGTNRFTVQVNAIGGRDQAVLEIVVDQDLTAPAAPSGLAAAAEDGSVRLNWDDNIEGDLAGYSIYRSTLSGSYGNALATNLTDSVYLDNTVTNGTTYYYVVTAVDSNGNISAASFEVSATPEAGLITMTKFLGSAVSGASNNWISTADNWDNGLPVGRQGTINTNAQYSSEVSHDGYSVLHTGGTVGRGSGFVGWNLGTNSTWIMDGASAAISATRGITLRDGSQFILNQGNANLTDNGRDTTIWGSGAAITINSGTMSIGRNLISRNGAVFTINAGSISVSGAFYTQNFASSAAGIMFNGGVTSANALHFDKDTVLTFGGSTTGSVAIATTYSDLSDANVYFDWLSGTKMSLTISGEDEWAEAEWNAGRLTYNGQGSNALSKTWAEVTAQDGLGTGVRFDYDSAAETLTLVSAATSGYDLWAAGWGTNNIGTATNDYELDGLVNWIEYALGGNPVSNDAAEILPEWSTGDDGGSNWFYYTYDRRDDAAARGLTYTVWSGTDLMDGGLSNAVPAWNVSPATNGFETATHRISTESAGTGFMELEIELSE